MANTIQFKRATAERWDELNPILLSGEPGYVIDADGDTHRYKIGDGKTAWKDLPFVGEASIINKPTHYDFPSIGKSNVIYKAESEKMIYQWNSSSLRYEPLNATESSGGLVNIELINGGNAYGIN